MATKTKTQKASGTKLSFEAEIGKVTLTSAKPDYTGKPVGGLVELALRVEMPIPPRPVAVRSAHAEYSYGTGPVKWKDYSSDKPETYVGRMPRKAKEESDEAFGRRKAAHDKQLADMPEVLAKWRAEQERDKQVYAGEVAAWERKMTLVRERQMAWAMLPGLSALFAGMKLNVVLTPADQEALPGFLLTVPTESDEPPLLDYPDATHLTDEEIDDLPSVNGESDAA